MRVEQVIQHLTAHLDANPQGSAWHMSCVGMPTSINAALTWRVMTTRARLRWRQTTRWRTTIGVFRSLGHSARAIEDYRQARWTGRTEMRITISGLALSDLGEFEAARPTPGHYP